MWYKLQFCTFQLFTDDNSCEHISLNLSLTAIHSFYLVSVLDQLRPFLDDSAGGFVERLFEALEESRSSRGNKGAGEKNRKRDLKVKKYPRPFYIVCAKPTE